MRTLDDLVRAGKIRYIGFSNTPAWVTAQAQTTALLRGWTPLIALQVEYSLLARTVEGELAPLALDQGMALVPWSPLKNGFLSGKYRRGRRGRRLRAHSLRRRSQRRRVRRHRRRRRRSPTSSGPPLRQWHWRGCWPGHGTVVPIVGARRLEHLESNLAGLEVTLTPEQLRVLDEVSAPALNYPADVNGATRAMLQFAGTTVDGETSTVYPPLLASDIRY